VSNDLHELLLEWWSVARAERDVLPWRSAEDPWAVLVAEVMLAQTQAMRVAPRYEAFLATYPSPQDLARSTPAEVLRRWEGLGYPRRALQLREAATRIVTTHAGEVPDQLESLLALPGVGPYISRAVLAFAFGKSVGVVDTNIGRVLARAVAGRRLGAREVQELADELVTGQRARSWNLALMDFGALCCRAREPRCSSCPLSANGACTWRADGDADDPARHSAAVSRPQARFAGSARQLRGEVLRILGAQDASLVELGARLDNWDSDAVERAVSSLIDDHLVSGDPACLRLG
jgi:A/G-specific adenine glycosylase